MRRLVALFLASLLLASSFACRVPDADSDRRLSQSLHAKVERLRAKHGGEPRSSWPEVDRDLYDICVRDLEEMGEAP